MENKSKLINSANEMMENRQGNCAQAIFATFGPHITKEKLDYEYCMKITSAFGGGINLTGNVCGAVTGALMTLGLIANNNIQEITKISSQFIEEFKKIHGTIICRELIGFEISNIEAFNEADHVETIKKCKKCVIDAACLVEKYIEQSEQSIKEEK